MIQNLARLNQRKNSRSTLTQRNLIQQNSPRLVAFISTILILGDSFAIVALVNFGIFLQRSPSTPPRPPSTPATAATPQVMASAIHPYMPMSMPPTLLYAPAQPYAQAALTPSSNSATSSGVTTPRHGGGHRKGLCHCSGKRPHLNCEISTFLKLSFYLCFRRHGGSTAAFRNDTPHPDDNWTSHSSTCDGHSSRTPTYPIFCFSSTLPSSNESK